MIYITEVHMGLGGTGHEHIAAVRWRNPQSAETGASTRQAMVEWIQGGNEARVRDNSGDDVLVGSLTPTLPTSVPMPTRSGLTICCICRGTDHDTASARWRPTWRTPRDGNV